MTIYIFKVKFTTNVYSSTMAIAIGFDIDIGK